MNEECARLLIFNYHRYSSWEAECCLCEPQQMLVRG